MNKRLREYLAVIEFRAFYFGSIQRKDICARFECGEATATRYFAKYRQLAPDNLLHNTREKMYIPSNIFKPLFNYCYVWENQGALITVCEHPHINSPFAVVIIDEHPRYPKPFWSLDKKQLIYNQKC